MNGVSTSGRHCMNAGSFETLSESPSKGDGPATNSKSDEGGKRLKPQRVKKKVRCPFISLFNSTLSRLT